MYIETDSSLNVVPSKCFSALEGSASPHYGAAFTDFPLSWMKLIVAHILCINVNHIEHGMTGIFQ